MSPKDTLAQFAAIGPSDQHKAEIRQSWFGSLFGQATVALIMIIAYFAAVGVLFKFVGDALEQFQKTNPFLFWAVITAPLILVFAFSVLPAILRARRERRLYPLSQSPTLPEPGYFRLHPYEETDKDRYSRPDGAVDEALAWITATTQPVLYLSGASGSGKSSLIHAGLAPKLRAEGWQVLHLRGMGAPLNTLGTALRAPALHGTPPIADATPRALLKSAGAERARAGAKPLLIVLDQFEEFLILDDRTEGGSDNTAYAALLRDLMADPVPGVVLLHVFRSDYRELIFREGLPDPVERVTAFSLPALTRRDAEAFLKGGPVQLEARGYDALFAGLDRIEEARGLYRPITLNMVGIVLQRQGPMLEADPARLIEAYLRDCITTGNAKDFSRPVLDMLITEAGTKAPRTAAALAEGTKLADWQVRATLEDLRRDGLVRCLDEVWEISHDFLARVIGQITGRLRRPWVTRVGTPAVLAVAAGWLVAIGMGVPAWVQWQERQVLAGIRALGVSQMPDREGGLAFRLEARGGFDNASFQQFGELAIRLPKITYLDLSGANGIDDLAPISKLTELTSLSLINADGIDDLTPIAGLTELTYLNLANADGIDDLAPIAGLTELTYLNLYNIDGIDDLTPIAGLAELTTLNLSGADGIKSLRPIDTLPRLSRLSVFLFRDTPNLTSLADIECTFLDRIDHDIPDDLLATCDE